MLKKVIVTGANGFIGSALCRELSKCEIEVVAIVKSDDSDVSSIYGIEGLQIISCDLKDISKLGNYLDERDFDAFFHLAWVGSSGLNRSDSNIQLKNVEYTCDAVKICKDLGCKRFIFAASIMEYELISCIDNNMSTINGSMYSAAKLSADYMARIISESVGVDYIRAVISNVYGPGEKSPRLINSSIRKMLRNEHCSFSPGEQLYDFIYITDAAKAFIAIAENGMTNKTYYIGSLEPKPLKNYLMDLKNLVNPNLDLGLGELPFKGVSLTYEEFERDAIKNDTGFVPEITFTEGIQNTIKWILENRID